MDDIKKLEQLAQETINELKIMHQPIVRVCGPLTTGGFGYEENACRLTAATAELKRRGYSVFDWEPSEAHIKDMNLPHSVVMEKFHKPVLASGYIKTAFFLSKWEESKGATWERNFARENTHMTIEEFPEEWFEHPKP